MLSRVRLNGQYANVDFWLLVSLNQNGHTVRFRVFSSATSRARVNSVSALSDLALTKLPPRSQSWRSCQFEQNECYHSRIQSVSTPVRSSTWTWTTPLTETGAVSPQKVVTDAKPAAHNALITIFWLPLWVVVWVRYVSLPVGSPANKVDFRFHQ